MNWSSSRLIIPSLDKDKFSLNISWAYKIIGLINITIRIVFNYINGFNLQSKTVKTSSIIEITSINKSFFSISESRSSQLLNLIDIKLCISDFNFLHSLKQTNGRDERGKIHKFKVNCNAF